MSLSYSVTEYLQVQYLTLWLKKKEQNSEYLLITESPRHLSRSYDSTKYSLMPYIENIAVC